MIPLVHVLPEHQHTAPDIPDPKRQRPFSPAKTHAGTEVQPSALSPLAASLALDETSRIRVPVDAGCGVPLVEAAADSSLAPGSSSSRSSELFSSSAWNWALKNS